MDSKVEKKTRLISPESKTMNDDIIVTHSESTTATETLDALDSLTKTCTNVSVGGMPIMQFLAEARQSMTRYERVEIEALIFYAARNESISEDTLRKEIQHTLAIPSLDGITRGGYRLVRSYLWQRIKRS